MTIRMGETYVANGQLTQAGYSALKGTEGDIAALTARVATAETDITTIETATSFVKLQAAVAAASQTSIDFTGVPVWANRITVMFDGLSTNGTSLVQVQLGDSGGVETTGYLSAATILAAGVSTTNRTSGFVLDYGSGALATNLRQGFVTLQKASGSTWVCGGLVALSDAAQIAALAGAKTLSAALDRVRVTTINGTDTFDAGNVSISWE